MRTQRIRHRFTAGLVALIALSLLAIPATAGHSWGKYHWTSQAIANPLPTIDNVDGNWDTYLDVAISDWNTLGSSPVKLTKDTRAGGDPVECSPQSGTIHVCNAAYGDNGWLGLAQIWVSKTHITQGTAKQNDTYFNTTTYNTPAWRLLVICQEIAHGFGLDHQDETFNNANLGSCMDYTNDPDGGDGGAVPGDPSNEHPNQHDFDQLVTIYGHTDGGKGGGGPRANDRAEQALGNNPSQWGEVVERDGQGRPSLYRKNLGDDRAVFTFVIWVEGVEAAAVEGTGDHGKRDGGKQTEKRQNRRD